jgi:hypothetical protein
VQIDENGAARRRAVVVVGRADSVSRPRHMGRSRHAERHGGGRRTARRGCGRSEAGGAAARPSRRRFRTAIQRREPWPTPARRPAGSGVPARR